LPQRGYKAVTITEEVYDLAKLIVKKYRKKLLKKRIRSISQLVEDAVIYYVENVLHEDIEKLIKEGEKT